MEENSNVIALLEEKVVNLLNQFKEARLSLEQTKQLADDLKGENEMLQNTLTSLKEENKSLKVANNLLGSKEGKTITRNKINSLIREVDSCINQLTDIY